MALYCLSVDAVALAAATAKTLVELGTASTDRLRIVQWWVEFDGITPTAVPVKIEVGRFSAAVTTATTLAGYPLDAADGTATTVAKHTTTTEGAGTFSGGETHRVSPTSGLIVQYPLGREWSVPVSGFWRIRATAPAIVNVTFGVLWEE